MLNTVASIPISQSVAVQQSYRDHLLILKNKKKQKQKKKNEPIKLM